MMGKLLNDKLKALPQYHQDLIQSSANELIAEEMTLRDFRFALDKTQQELCLALHMKLISNNMQTGLFSCVYFMN